MALIQDYIEYFKYQAEQHPQLLHTEDKRVFEVVDVEEAWGDYRTKQKEKDFSMRLVLPSGGLADAEQSDNMVQMMGGFFVIRYWDKRNTGDTDMLTALDESYAVCMDIVEKMVSDSKNGYPLWYWSVNSPEQLDLSFQPKIYAGDANYAGYLVLFKWHTALRNCITHADAPVWPDGGTTPFPK